MLVEELPTTDVKPMVNSAPLCSDSDAVMENQHTGSGGFYTFWSRRRSLIERERISRSRAQELSDRYELCDDKADNLNKNAQIGPSVRETKSSISSSSRSSILQVFLHHNDNNDNSGSSIAVDPLMAKTEKKVERRTSKGSSSVRSKSLKIVIEQLLDEISTEPSDSDSSSTPLSEDETVANTPSPVYGSMYYASNGRSYWVNKLC